MTDQTPIYLKDTNWHPGEFIKDQMDFFGYNQKELARRLKTTEKKISLLLSGKATITEEYAQRLEKVLGLTANLWLSLQTNYNEAQKRAQENKILLKYKDWIRRFHICEVEKLGIIPKRDNTPDRIREMLQLFHIADPTCVEAELETLCVNYRTRKIKTATLEGRYVWLSIGKRTIESLQPCEHPYNKQAFTSMLKDLRKNLRTPTSKEKLQNLFANVGVSLIFIPAIKGNAVFGATYRHCNRPVIQMICKYDDDRFWFNLFHETGHVLHDHKSITSINTGENSSSDSEIAADNHAKNIILPDNDFKPLLDKHAKHPPLKSEISQYAKQFNLPDSIILGRFQFHKIIPYDRYNDLKNKLSFTPDLPSQG